MSVRSVPKVNYPLLSLLSALIIFILLIGCGSSQVRKEDFVNFEGSKKYPLKVAIISKDTQYSTANMRTKFRFLKIDHDFMLSKSAEEFFGIFFNQVYLYSSDESLKMSDYDLIIKLTPINVLDLQGKGKIISFANLKANVNVDFFRSDGKLIFGRNYKGIGKSYTFYPMRGSRSSRLGPATITYYKLYNDAAKKAIKDIFETLGQYINKSPIFLTEHATYIAATKQKEMERITLPAYLNTKVKYSDTNSLIYNNTIDAGEESNITVFIKNESKGTAFDVKVKTDSDYENIDFPESLSIGDIQPGETKEVTVNLKAGLDLESGKVPFTIYAAEKRGYDSKKVKVLIPTARLEKPDLVFVDYRIDDGNTGLAQGNGNGIAESGETIELTAFIKNEGHGKAIGVNMTTAGINTGIKWVRDEMLLGIIPPGQTVKAKVASPFQGTLIRGRFRHC